MAGMTVPAQLEPSVLPDRPGLTVRTERASAGSFGAYSGAAAEKVGSAMQQAGDVAANNAIRFQVQQNETDVDAANTAYDNQRRKMLFDEGGFYTKKGKDAYEAMQPTSKAIEDLRNEVRQNLANPEQQKMFDAISRRSTQMDLRAMDMHAATENQNYRVGVAEAAIGNAQANASSYWNDPYRFAQSLGEIAVQAENRARLIGHTDPQQIKADVAHYQSGAWVDRIKAMMAENPLLAKATYEANKDQIYDPKQKAALEHELKTVALPEEARIIATNIIAKAPEVAPQAGTQRVAAKDFPKESPVEALTAAQRQLEILEKEAADDPKAPNASDRAKEIERSRALVQELTAKQGSGPADRVEGQAGEGAQPAAPTTARDTKAQLATWLPAAEREAERLHPGNQTFKDLVTTQIMGHVNKIAAMQEAISRQAHGTVMAAAIQPDSNGAKPLTVQELMERPGVRNAWSLLTPEAMHGFTSANGVLAQNGKEATGEYVRGDPKLANSLANRFYLQDGDPQKITSPTQLTQYRSTLNHAQWKNLTEELSKASTPDGNPFLKQVNGIKKTAHSMLIYSTKGVMHPDVAEEAAYRFAEDLDKKIAALRSTNPPGDPQELFNSSNPNYVLDINRVASFMQGAKPQTAAVSGRTQVPANAPAEPGVQKRLPGEKPADYLKRIGKLD